MARKSFNDKLMASKDLPKIVEVSDNRTIARYGGNRMLIAPPLLYDAIMKRVPYGMVITTDAIRDHLAKSYDANFACPLTAGIFINIVANASEERGADKTPYWRTLKKGGLLNEKYPGGAEQQKTLLEMEGHSVQRKGKNYIVAGYESNQYEL